MFLGDQGRDAIIFKRLITFEHLPAIGAPTSVGLIYMGPFFYYLIAPWLLITNFNPVGAALGTAILSIIALVLQYFIVKKIFGTVVSIIALFLSVFSYVLVDFARFSWNPNLLPQFAFFTWFSLYKAASTKKLIWYFATGAFYALCLQLHYLSLFLAIPIFIYIFLGIKIEKKIIISIITRIVAAGFGFALCFLPLILFEIKHQFLNTKAILHLSSAQGAVRTNYFSSLSETFRLLNEYIFHFSFNATISLLLLIVFGIFFIWTLRNKKYFPLTTLFVVFFSLLFGTALYSGPKYPHYLGAMDIIYICLIASLLATLATSFKTLPLIIVFICIYIVIQVISMPVFTIAAPNQINRARKIAETIYPKITQPIFSVNSLPGRYDDSTFRYFLEIMEKRPLDPESMQKTDELFITCEHICEPLKSSQWEISYFAPKGIEWQTISEGAYIYKLYR